MSQLKFRFEAAHDNLIDIAKDPSIMEPNDDQL